MKAPPKDRRLSSRINQSWTVRIRPAESDYAEEIRTTLNASWDGLYFATSLGHYYSGMIVHVTPDFHTNDSKNREEGRHGRAGGQIEGRQVGRGHLLVPKHLAEENQLIAPAAAVA
jgi:hypothetical protein